MWKMENGYVPMEKSLTCPFFFSPDFLGIIIYNIYLEFKNARNMTHQTERVELPAFHTNMYKMTRENTRITCKSF